MCTGHIVHSLEKQCPFLSVSGHPVPFQPMACHRSSAARPSASPLLFWIFFFYFSDLCAASPSFFFYVRRTPYGEAGGVGVEWSPDLLIVQRRTAMRPLMSVMSAGVMNVLRRSRVGCPGKATYLISLSPDGRRQNRENPSTTAYGVRSFFNCTALLVAAGFPTVPTWSLKAERGS
jgi:hypothetical protein